MAASSSPDDVVIPYEDTDMMDDRSLANPLVEEEPHQVLGGVHGGHVDHDLGVVSVVLGVEHVEISPVHGRQAHPAGGKDKT